MIFISPMRHQCACITPVFPNIFEYFLLPKGTSIEDVLLNRRRGNTRIVISREQTGEEDLKISILPRRPLWMPPWMEYWTGIMQS